MREKGVETIERALTIFLVVTLTLVCHLLPVSGQACWAGSSNGRVEGGLS